MSVRKINTDPRLLVRRKNEFAKLHKRLEGIPLELSQSIALLARKKNGKTAIVQRLFNELWKIHRFYDVFEIQQEKDFEKTCRQALTSWHHG